MDLRVEALESSKSRKTRTGIIPGWIREEYGLGRK